MKFGMYSTSATRQPQTSPWRSSTRYMDEERRPSTAQPSHSFIHANEATFCIGIILSISFRCGLSPRDPTIFSAFPFSTHIQKNPDSTFSRACLGCTNPIFLFLLIIAESTRSATGYPLPRLVGSYGRLLQGVSVPTSCRLAPVSIAWMTPPAISPWVSHLERSCSITNPSCT